MRIGLFTSLLTLLALRASGQPPGVPVYPPDLKAQEETALTNAANLLLQAGQTLAPATVREQLHRTSCRLDLMKPAHTKLTAREVYDRARAGCLRVGWFYLCTQCDRWHLNLAGGYSLTADGAVGTSYHVAEPPRDLRAGCLIAADDAGKVFPVTEILAANRYSDACLIRIKGSGFVPLPLSTNLYPGDTVYCLSNPLERRGYFSQGIVNRFFKLPERRLPSEPGTPLFAPTRINVSCDWSFGSSGAPVLDEFGNVVGHVSTITVEGDGGLANPKATQETIPPTIVFHEAVSARDVLGMVKQVKPE